MIMCVGFWFNLAGFMIMRCMPLCLGLDQVIMEINLEAENQTFGRPHRFFQPTPTHYNCTCVLQIKNLIQSVLFPPSMP